jgi:hypothetical protein
MGELAEVAGEAHLGGTYVDGVLPSSSPDQGALSSRGHALLVTPSRHPPSSGPTTPSKKVFLKREKKKIPQKNQLERKKRKERNDSSVIPFPHIHESQHPPP